MNSRRPMRMQRRRREHGIGLIELMIALLLGLMVIGGATSVFLSNKQSYRSNSALSQVQENSRIAFELLARDIRQAGLTGCGNTNRVANVLNNQATDWWADFSNAVHGYDDDVADPAVTIGTGTAQRAAGTDSVELLGVSDSGLSVESHNPTSANFKLNDSTADIQDGDVVIVCDPDHATITQVTNYNSSNVTLVHNTGTASPGNCSKGLGFPSDCSSTNGNSYEFGRNSQIAKLSAVDWYIGHNPQGGLSLYRASLGVIGGTPGTTAQEMVRNVRNMQLTYHIVGSNTYVNATTVAANWPTVDAVLVTLDLVGNERNTGTDAQPISRQFSATITLRNRVN